MRFSTLAFSALILATPMSAFAQDHQGGGMHGFFSPEQREMYRETQGDGDWKSMTDEQRHAKFDEMRAKFAAMNDADKAKLKADMQAKFDALSPAQKQAVEQKIAERHAEHEQKSGQ